MCFYSVRQIFHNLLLILLLQQSWSDNMLERIRNVIKRDAKSVNRTDECGATTPNLNILSNGVL